MIIAVQAFFTLLAVGLGVSVWSGFYPHARDVFGVSRSLAIAVFLTIVLIAYGGLLWFAA